MRETFHCFHEYQLLSNVNNKFSELGYLRHFLEYCEKQVIIVDIVYFL